MRIEELQEKLEGIYDLDKPVDAKAVVALLLRDLDKSNKRAEDAVTNLRILALLVVNMKPDAIEKAKSVLGGIPKKSDADVWNFVAGMSKEMGRAGELKDKEIVDEVLDNIWADLDMQGRESAVLGEMVRRYKDMAGVKDVGA